MASDMKRAVTNEGIRKGISLAIQYLAIKTIWIPRELKRYRDHRENPCKDICDYFLHMGTSDSFEKLVSRAKPLQFWNTVYTKDDSVKIRLELFF